MCYSWVLCCGFCYLQELLSRTSLETQKLALMAEVSNLNMKLTTMGKDQLEFDDRFRDSEVRAGVSPTFSPLTLTLS